MRNRFAKILATLGPASRAPQTLRLLHEVGVDAFRLNFSHGSHEDHAESVKNIRRVQEQCGNPITIVADMQGPKLRCGPFESGSIELKYGETVSIELSEALGKPGLIRMPHPELIEALNEGHILKFDDGKMQVTILEKTDGVLKARVDVPGTLSDRKGINVINAVLPMSAMTDKDRVDMAFALTQDVDYIALSFVQTAQDVIDARKIIGDKAGIIVKIEKPSAVEELDDILAHADAAMVARGDLGVELPLELVPVVQRQIIRKGRALGKPVIVATHMLESMIDSPTPTRAEASDVATAIYLGADAVMLSAETAVGRHPATAVAIMDRIITAAENDPEFWRYFDQIELPHEPTAEDAIGQSVRSTAKTLGCKAVLGYTLTGSTVQRISRERPPCRVVGLTPRVNTANRLALSWGVLPIVMEDPVNFDDMLGSVQTVAKNHAGLAKGDRIMISAGVPFGRPGTTNLLKIETVD
ncbi:pyruvate kinase [Litorimonas taeanensis]|uniref:Pyruvate kinase n=1 Tax=Litorimonas taeanensis TaxID=568099 RepID=A0A420WIF5_9PROT|nr:pyruvate kinase [Litorimonas taeanensis]RKQ70773.1 pyruvate kinase [Litorimonas taeanensis]